MPARIRMLDGAPTAHGCWSKRLASIFTSLPSKLPGGNPHEEEETKVRTRGYPPKATQLGRAQSQLTKMHFGTVTTGSNWNSIPLGSTRRHPSSPANGLGKAVCLTHRWGGTLDGDSLAHAGAF